MSEGKIKIEEEEEDNFSFDIDNEADFLKDAAEPREGYEINEEEDLEGDWADEEEGEEPPRMSETTEEDEAYFKLFMGFIDNTRASVFSLYVGGDMEKVKDYKIYNNWDDPQHAEILRAGRIVAKKYKFHAFDHLPELMIVGSILMSSYFLYKQAKNEKEEKQKETTKAQQPRTQTPIVKMKKFV
jgi:hypothetical protein